MGVNANTYVAYGIKYDYTTCPIYDKSNSDSYDRLAPYMPSWNKPALGRKLSVIFDGMSGKYIFVGKVLAEASQEDGGDLEWMELIITEQLKQEVIASFKDIFNLDISNSPDLKLYAFTHYS